MRYMDYNFSKITFISVKTEDFDRDLPLFLRNVFAKADFFSN